MENETNFYHLHSNNFVYNKLRFFSENRKDPASNSLNSNQNL